MRNLCDLGMHLLNGTAVSDGTYRVNADGKDVYPDDAAGHLLARTWW